MRFVNHHIYKMKTGIIIILVCMILLIGIVFVSAKLIEEKKIKDIKEIDCNKKYDPSCNEKIKIKDEETLRIDLGEDLKTGKEVFKVYAN